MSCTFKSSSRFTSYYCTASWPGYKPVTCCKKHPQRRPLHRHAS